MNTARSLGTLRIVLVAGMAFAAVACGIDVEGDVESEPTSTTQSALDNSSSGVATGPCTVISGANSGKVGTFNADGDCEGSWGISECKNQDGTDSGKCAAGRVIVQRPRPWCTTDKSLLNR